MKPKTNIFGQRICDKDKCVAWVTEEPMYEGDTICGHCLAGLDYLGRVSISDDPVVYGLMCHLPVTFGVVRLQKNNNHATKHQ